MVYVETSIRAEMDKLWAFTQDPTIHQRWDLRFTNIEYLPKENDQDPQRFLYVTRLGFGMSIAGEGESTGTREADGSRTSALKFWSQDSKSLIETGSGYWQYQERGGCIKFCTGYDYKVRFGALGKLFDKAVFRPLIGWATAWSFDCLRLWLEQGIEPEVSIQRARVYGASRFTLAFIWIYQGLVPKMIFPDAGDLAIMTHNDMLNLRQAHVGLTATALGEILFGLLLLAFWRSRRLLKLQFVLLVLLTLGGLIADARMFVRPFNPLTLNVAMIALGWIALSVGKELPTASHCKRTKGKE